MNKFFFHFCLISLLLSSHSHGMEEQEKQIRSGRALPTPPKPGLPVPAQNKESSPALKPRPQVPQRPLLPDPKGTLPTPEKDTTLSYKKVQPTVPQRPMSPPPTTPLLPKPPARPLSPPPKRTLPTPKKIVMALSDQKVPPQVPPRPMSPQLEKTSESAEIINAPEKSPVDLKPTKQKQRGRSKTESDKSSKFSPLPLPKVSEEAPADLQTESPKRDRSKTLRKMYDSVTAKLGKTKTEAKVKTPEPKEETSSLPLQSPKVPYYKQGTYSRKTQQLMEKEGLDKSEAERIAKISNLYGNLVNSDASENVADPLSKLLGQIKPTSKVQIKQSPAVKDQDPQNTEQSKN